MDPASSTSDVLSNGISALLTPFGLAAALVALLIMIAALSSRGWRWAILAGALWMTTFEIGAGDQPTILRLWGPLELIRVNGRLLATGALLSLLMPAIGATRGWRTKLTSGAAASYLLLQIVFCGRLLIAGNSSRAIGSLAIYCAIFLIMSRGVAGWMQEAGHAVAMLRSIAIAGVMCVGVNAVQLLISPSNAMWVGRLNGTAGNAQHMAINLAVFLPAVIFLLLRKEETRTVRLCLAATVGLTVVMLGMTGSRTGALMSMTVIVVMFRRWLGKLLKLAVISLVMTFLAFLIFPDTAIQTDRFITTEDTRSAVWSELIGDFVTHPLMGNLNHEPGIRESSYLSVAARLGIIGLIPLILMIFYAFTECRRLGRLRPALGEYTMMVDVVIAGLASLAVGAVSEGFLLGTIILQVYMIYLYLSLATFLGDIAEQSLYAVDPHDVAYRAPAEKFYFAGHDF